MAITKYNVEQGSDEWFNLKLAVISGSMFDNLMKGKSTAAYSTLIYEVAYQIISGNRTENPITQPMRDGSENEHRVIKVLEDVLDIETEEVGFVTNDYIFNDYIGVSPDRYVKGKNVIIEAKYPKPTTQLKYIDKDVMPKEYIHQVQGQLMVTGAEYCWFISWTDDLNPFIIKIMPDVEIHGKMFKRMKEAIADVLNVVDKHNEIKLK